MPRLSPSAEFDFGLGRHFNQEACFETGHARNGRFVCRIGFRETICIAGNGAIFCGKSRLNLSKVFIIHCDLSPSKFSGEANLEG
jgi:hypothetical protein